MTLLSKRNETTQRATTGPGTGADARRPSAVQRIVCAALIVAFTPVAPAVAKPGSEGVKRVTASARPELLVTAVRIASTATPETRLQRTIRVLRSTVREPGAIGDLHVELAVRALAGAPDAGAAERAVQGSSQSGGLPWWAWALIGAGTATAVTQIEFGSKDGDD